MTDHVDTLVPGEHCSWCKHWWSNRCFGPYRLEKTPTQSPDHDPEDLSVFDDVKCEDFWMWLDKWPDR